MGLAIVQRQYDGQDNSNAPSPTSPDEPEKKKRKIGNPLKGLMSGFVLNAIEEDDPYSPGKKQKGGIGYAGNVKEDVSVALCLMISSLTKFYIDDWPDRSDGFSKVKRC